MKVLEKVSPFVKGIMPYEPGRPIEEVAKEKGLDPSTIAKLASNENPLGPSPLAVEAMRTAITHCHRYPDGGGFGLRSTLAETYGLSLENVLLGNGSNEILELVGHCFLAPGRSAVFSRHAFIVYKLVSMLFGAEMREVPTTDGFAHDLDAMRAAVSDDTAVVFLCSPNNPTGTMLDPLKVTAFVESLPDDVLVVIDEAYAEIAQGNVGDSLAFVRQDRPVIVCRTFSKAYGLAGLRIGYALASPPLVDALNRSRQPFNCNLVAQAAATAALGDESFIQRYRDLCRDSKAYFESFCMEHGLEFVPSGGNFMLIRVGDGRGVFEELQTQGVIVRPMDGYGLGEYVRVSYGLMDENRRCAQAIATTCG